MKDLEEKKKKKQKKTKKKELLEHIADHPPEREYGFWVCISLYTRYKVSPFGADGFTYTFGVFFVQLMPYFDASAAATSWIASILVGVTLGSALLGCLVECCSLIGIPSKVNVFISVICNIINPPCQILGMNYNIFDNSSLHFYYFLSLCCNWLHLMRNFFFLHEIMACGSPFSFRRIFRKIINDLSWQGCLVVLSGIVLNCVVFGAMFRPLEDNQYPTEEDIIDNTEMPMIKVSESSPVNKIRENFSDNNLILQGSSGTTNGNANYNQFGSHGALNPLQENLKNQETSRMAMSQPLLPGATKTPSHTGSSQRINGLGSSQRIGPSKSGSLPPSHHGSGLLYRKDIFYRGSLVNLPEYKNDPQGYRMSITKLPDVEITEPITEKSKVCGCIPCNRETRDALYSLTDWSLLTDGIFLLFSLSNFCTSIGFNAPYVFIVDRAVHLGVSNNDAAYLLSVVGIANTVSRIGLGWISDQPWVNRLYLYNVALTICGVGTCCVFWMTSYASQVFYAVLFGSMSGAYVGLTSVVLVDLLGMEKLTNAFGLLLMFQGIASLIGPPMCGALFDATGSYDYSFLLAGSMIAISGLMLFFIPCIWKIQARNIAKKDANRL
ncbi:unnamed protein product, partial [Meganyctiphanes norvegica]